MIRNGVHLHSHEYCRRGSLADDHGTVPQIPIGELSQEMQALKEENEIRVSYNLFAALSSLRISSIRQYYGNRANDR
jgi:hypothetical protein